MMTVRLCAPAYAAETGTEEVPAEIETDEAELLKTGQGDLETPEENVSLAEV